MNERIEAIISGTVQGVWFRDFACRRARALGLVGEVQNISDGTVRAIAEGPRDRVEEFIRELEKGSPLAHVDHVKVEWHPATDAYTSFEIS